MAQRYSQALRRRGKFLPIGVPVSTTSNRAASPAAPTTALLYIVIPYSLHVVDIKRSTSVQQEARIHDGIEMQAGRGLKALLRIYVTVTLAKT